MHCKDVPVCDIGRLVWGVSQDGITGFGVYVRAVFQCVFDEFAMITVVLDFGFQRIDGRPNFRSVVIVTKVLPKGDGIGLGVKAVLGKSPFSNC